MRLFVALEVPDGWRTAADETRAALEREVRELPLRLRWVEPASLHLTLRFLGEMGETHMPELRAALDAHVPPVDVDVALDGVSTFGGAARTSVVWFGIGGDVEGLQALAGRVERAVRAAGVGVPLTPTLSLKGRGGRTAEPGSHLTPTHSPKGRGGRTVEERPFRPHLTLARVDRAAAPAGRRALGEAITALPRPAAQAFVAREVVLVRSYLGGGPPRYEVLARIG